MHCRPGQQPPVGRDAGSLRLEIPDTKMQIDHRLNMKNNNTFLMITASTNIDLQELQGIEGQIYFAELWGESRSCFAVHFGYDRL
jgi:hypothetical protein